MHVYNCILCSGPSLVYILMVVSYALALFLFAFLRPYPMLRDFSCIYFCGLILYSWFSSAYICTTKSYTLGILFECISFVCIVTTVSYALGLPSYALLQPYPMLWTSFCIHSKDRILCPGSSCVCIFKNVSYALGLLLHAFLWQYSILWVFFCTILCSGSSFIRMFMTTSYAPCLLSHTFLMAASCAPKPRADICMFFYARILRPRWFLPPFFIWRRSTDFI